MADLYEQDLGTAFYRSRDPIKNLKICIKLERVTSASIVPQAVAEQEAGGNMELRNMKMKKNFGGKKDIEEYTFKWQEKVFSRREVDLYSQPDRCVSVIDRKYQQEVKPYREQGVTRPTKRLFTYVDYDDFTNQDEAVQYMTTSPNEEPSLLAQKMTTIRQRRKTVTRARDNENSVVPKLNVVVEEPSREVMQYNHFHSTPFQTMHIMADLSPMDREATEEDEFILCTVKVDSNGVVSIKPDFNKGRRSYRIEASGQGRDAYEYTIEHASFQMNRQEQDRDRKMYRELYQRHSEFLTACVGADFEMPPPNVLRLLVYGEIVSAKDFEYSDLYIHYFVELPKHWTADGSQLLSGVTQTCSTKVIDRDDVAYFSFPFNFELFYRDDTIDEEKRDLMPTWPQLFIEVLSLDSWQRYRTEGYGYATLPTKPGVETITVNCWRPAGRSVVGEMRRFFIGGSPELEDPTYTAVPSTFEGSRLSKYGFTTISTGSVTVKLNSIQQSQSFLHSAANRKKMGTLVDRLGANATFNSIAAILDAFQKARQKMIAVRDNLKQDFVETLRAYVEEDSDEG